MKKKIVTWIMMLALTMVFTACGGDNGEEAKPSNGPSDSSSDGVVSDVNNNANESEQKDSEEKTSIITAKEKDIVVYIDGKKVKLDQTWEEFQKMVEDYGWTFTDERINDWPHYDEEEKEYDYTGQGYVQTPIGKVRFCFMNNEDETGAVLRSIYFLTCYITENDLNVCGINLTTTWEEVGRKLELVYESEYGKSYKVDDWVEVYIENPYEGKSNVKIERTMFHMRNK